MLLLSMLSEKQKQKNICSKYLTDLERVFVCLVGWVKRKKQETSSSSSSHRRRILFIYNTITPFSSPSIQFLQHELLRSPAAIPSSWGSSPTRLPRKGPLSPTRVPCTRLPSSRLPSTRVPSPRLCSSVRSTTSSQARNRLSWRMVCLFLFLLCVDPVSFLFSFIKILQKNRKRLN